MKLIIILALWVMKKSRNKHIVSMSLFVKEGHMYNKYCEHHEKYIYDTDKVLILFKKLDLKFMIMQEIVLMEIIVCL